MDEDEKAEFIFKECQFITKLFVDFTLGLQKPEIKNDYPDFPFDLPDELRFEYPKKKKKNKKPKIAPVKVEEVIQKEALKFIGEDIPRTRRTKYQGSYNVTEMESAMFQVVETTKSKPIDTKKDEPKKTKISESQSKAKSPKKKQKIRSLSESSSDEEVKSSVNIAPNVSHLHNIIKGSVKRELNFEISKPVLEDKIQKPKIIANAAQDKSKLSIIQKVFKNNESFDDGIKKFIAITKKEIPKPVKIIPPPKNDPMQKPKKKIKMPLKNQKSPANNEKLGGIFTIHNGWDAEEPSSSSSMKHPSTPPFIHENDADDENNSQNMDYDPFVITPIKIHKNINITEESFSNDKCMIETPLKEAENSNSNSDEKVNTAENKNRKILDSDDDTDDDQCDKIVEANDIAIEDDTLLLCDDYGDLNEFENEDNVCETELVDNKIKIKFISKPKTLPQNPETEFEENTKEIENYAVDPATTKILKQYFGNVCPAFVDNKCTIHPNCMREHVLITSQELMMAIQHLPNENVLEIFRITLRFNRLFAPFIEVFANIFAHRNYELGLIQLIKGCECTPRNFQYYTTIYKAIVDSKRMTNVKAIKFIICHHTDNSISRDIILKLIVDSGPYLVYFVDYLESIYSKSKSSIGPEMFDRILDTCVAFQHPQLPNFCLNYMQSSDLSVSKKLNLKNLESFIKMQKCISEIHESRELKLINLTRNYSKF